MELAILDSMASDIFTKKLIFEQRSKRDGMAERVIGIFGNINQVLIRYGWPHEMS